MFSLLLLIALPAAQAITDMNCTSNSVYTANAVACDNVYSDASCGVIYLNNTAVQAGGSDERPAPCFNGTNGPSEDIKAMAIANCPKTCGYCCQTAEYACSNAPYPRIQCGTITDRMCRDPTWRNIIAADCPNACGFCLLGGCIDAAPDCNLQPTVCVTRGMEAFVATYCQRTCGLCGSSTTAASASSAAGVTSGTATTGATATCADADVRCKGWIKNGFCTSRFYASQVKRARCARSCNLCA